MDSYISFYCLVLSLFSGSGCAVTVHGYVGGIVTLTCKYDAGYYNVLSVCWGRGHIPNSGCGNEILRTEGLKVTHRTSDRYRLLGSLRAGDVSLSIFNAQLKDSGIYGCRVDIPGWFNDQKHHLALVIQPGEQATTAMQTTTAQPVPPEPPTLEVQTVSARMASVCWSAGFDGNSAINSYLIEHKRQTDSWDVAEQGPEILSWERVTAITNLRPVSSYNIRMFARNDAGLSTASNVLNITTIATVPDGPPMDVKLEALSAHSIKVTWRAPEPSLQNGPIKGYMIRYAEYSPQGQFPVKVVYVMDGGESFTVNNLEEETNYTVTLVAINSAGLGPFSKPLICITLCNDNLEQMTTTQATTEIQTEHPVSTIEATSLTDSWVIVTLSPTQYQKVDFSTTQPSSDSTVDMEAPRTEKLIGHLVAILVPTLVLGLLVVMAIVWKIRRSALKKGTMNIQWKKNDFMSFENSEPAL
ncbi:Down syndrome cell adhesion molecule homolog isoform X2 [Esox lucius]|uniref:Down syndrome cell adhesion molecule homolog isoform X2 n=1 Tax=Esox lucius TaxID=8010 RepID=UPI00097342DE|nr:Down syndrome cell adhesion molecule homolog isoform X2 [Esox lucius]